MPSPIDLALTSLLPHVAFPPEELQRLATSLLTQSRARAPRLKADEEVARTFACAHIACERLRNRLALEIGKDVRPPCPPRVYARLKGFLAEVLGASQQQQQQQQTQQNRTLAHDARRTPRKTVPSARTPVDTPEITPTTTPKARRKRGIDEVEGEEEDSDGIPLFATGLLAHLCAACKVSATLVDRTRAGAVEVVKEIASRRKLEVDAGSASKRRRVRSTPRGATQVESSPAQPAPVVPTSRWPALLIALFLCTVAKVRGQDLDEAKTQDTRRHAVAAISTLDAEGKSEVLSQLAREPDSLDKMVAFYLLEAGDCGWLDMQWYHDIPTTGDVEDDDQADEEDELPIKPRRRPAKTPLRRKEKHGGRDDTGADMGPAGLLPGLGTMFQPAVDWLSDDRRAQFARWKQDMLGRIATVEQQA